MQTLTIEVRRPGDGRIVLQREIEFVGGEDAEISVFHPERAPFKQKVQIVVKVKNGG